MKWLHRLANVAIAASVLCLGAELFLWVRSLPRIVIDVGPADGLTPLERAVYERRDREREQQDHATHPRRRAPGCGPEHPH